MTYLKLEQRVSLLEGILREALADTEGWWVDAEKALTPEPKTKLDGVCKCKHTALVHASNGLCCGESCECLRFSP